MGSLATWLAGLAWPLVSRVLVSLGIGVVSYAGASVALNAALDASRGAFGAIGGPVMQIMAMAGGFQAVSIIAGALVAGLAFTAIKKLMLVSGT